MSSASPSHEPITRERHAAIVDELCRNNARVWLTIYAPLHYLYDDRDQQTAAGIETELQSLRIAFQSVTDWSTMIYQVRRMLHLEKRRRSMSIGSIIDGRTFLGEAVG